MGAPRGPRASTTARFQQLLGMLDELRALVQTGQIRAGATLDDLDARVRHLEHHMRGQAKQKPAALPAASVEAETRRRLEDAIAEQERRASCSV